MPRNKRKRRKWLKAYYKKLRKQLLLKLGHKCFLCDYKWTLQFHHLKRRTWVAKNYNKLQRLRLYKRDIENKLVVLACKGCNRRIGKPKDIYDPNEIPL